MIETNRDISDPPELAGTVVAMLCTVALIVVSIEVLRLIGVLQ